LLAHFIFPLAVTNQVMFLCSLEGVCSPANVGKLTERLMGFAAQTKANYVLREAVFHPAEIHNGT